MSYTINLVKLHSNDADLKLSWKTLNAEFSSATRASCNGKWTSSTLLWRIHMLLKLLKYSDTRTVHRILWQMLENVFLSHCMAIVDRICLRIITYGIFCTGIYTLDTVRTLLLFQHLFFRTTALFKCIFPQW